MIPVELVRLHLRMEEGGGREVREESGVREYGTGVREYGRATRGSTGVLK